MDYLTLVQQSMYKCGLRSENPSTLVGALDITLDFKIWVQDSWRELQEESTNWWFRSSLDQTLALTTSQDSYAMPTDFETINYRTVSVYTVAKEDEQVLTFIPYEEWRMRLDTTLTTGGRPVYITQTPAQALIVWPAPDQAYTLRFDGVWDIDEMLIDSDTPGFNRTGATSLQDRYHWVLVYDAARRYAEHHQDAAGVAKAQSKFLSQHARLTEKRKPAISVPVGILTGMSRNKQLRNI